jgi:transketolase N-terminal domain/subunit
MDKQFFERATKSVRRKILKAITLSGKGHIGGAFSCADVLYYLFSEQIIQISELGKITASPLIMSKGHSATALLPNYRYNPRWRDNLCCRRGAYIRRYFINNCRSKPTLQ